MARLLIVDDEPYNLLLIEDLLQGTYELVKATDGQEAWEILDRDPGHFDAVVLDRVMPRMDGMETLRRIRADARFDLVPVVMQTAACAPNEVAEGLAAGAWYYLTKPYEGSALQNIVAAALMDRASRMEIGSLDTNLNVVIAMTQQANYRFRSPFEARQLASALARLCPTQPGVSMGLSELGLNAIEHGNLGFNYEEKGRLMLAGTWQEEVERRLRSSDFAERYVELEFRHEGDRLRFTVRDQGKGFDWNKYLELDPERAFDSHGRGIAMAKRFAFESLEYQGAGNVVVATVKL